ncbi:DUF397 domain-containing protein [Kitasatospora sp. NPDC053057]|uniref:DUF397 domain-containing protein n=1 Tax=Kitasatospora sp. NPDC053057 TaxID=3364062 RepID=UPI0037CAD627
MTYIKSASAASLKWRKSTYSGNNNNCVEVADLPDGSVAVRDSKNPDGPALIFPRSVWNQFAQGAGNGDFPV